MADAGKCEYIVREPQYRSCGEPAPYMARFDGRDHWLCERHVQPEFHAPDLRKRLPGALTRLTRRGKP